MEKENYMRTHLRVDTKNNVTETVPFTPEEEAAADQAALDTVEQDIRDAKSEATKAYGFSLIQVQLPDISTFEDLAKLKKKINLDRT